MKVNAEDLDCVNQIRSGDGCHVAIIDFTGDCPEIDFKGYGDE